MAEQELFFKDPRDLLAYFEADHCLKVSSASAEHLMKVGHKEMAGFFVMQATNFQLFMQELARRQSGIQIVPAIPGRIKPPGI